jgi:hypothetical protein
MTDELATTMGVRFFYDKWLEENISTYGTTEQTILKAVQNMIAADYVAKASRFIEEYTK